MLIGIDGNEANVDKKVGISEFAYRLISEFDKRRDGNSFRVYLKNNPRPDLPPPSIGWNYRIVGPAKLWTQIGLPFHLFADRPRPDVFFTPTHYAPRFSPIPTVVSVMDVSYIHYPELFRKRDLFQLKNWTSYSVKHATSVITISNSSKDDIIKEYAVNPSKIVVVYPGIKKDSSSKIMQTMDNLRSKYNVKNDYILFVGTIQPRKNIERLIEAYSQVVSNKNRKFSNLDLVIVGKKGWLYEEIISAPQKHGVEDRVKFLDFVSDQDLPSFYENARLFVLPSLYEGFGLPVLEAMKYKCPVISSNISSLPEAGGDAALYFDPYDVSDIADKINKVLKNEKLASNMKKAGLAQVKKFSWEKAAKEVLKVIEGASKI